MEYSDWKLISHTPLPGLSREADTISKDLMQNCSISIANTLGFAVLY